MLLCDEGPLQAHWLDGRRSDPVADSARGRDLGATAANQHSAANGSNETRLQRHRSVDGRASLDVIMPIGPDALAFTIRHRQEFAVCIPVVFVGISRASYEASKAPSDITGHVIDLDLNLDSG
jgi:hypothetical protein